MRWAWGRPWKPTFWPLNSSNGGAVSASWKNNLEYRNYLEAFAATLGRIDASNFSKYQRLLAYLQGTLVDLERLQAAQVQQLELRLEKQLEQVRRSQFERRSQVIRRVFDEYRQWVEDTLSTEPEPYLQVLAAVCG